MTTTSVRPANLRELRDSGWVSKTVKREIYDNFMARLAGDEELFPGIIGYENTVIPEINLAIIAQHDMLFLGEKGQAKSRLMRSLVRFLDEEIPYIDLPDAPVHDDPYRPVSGVCKRFVAETPDDRVPIRWWPRGSATPSGWRQGRSSPTSSARSIPPSWPAARVCRPKRRCTSG